MLNWIWQWVTGRNSDGISEDLSDLSIWQSRAISEGRLTRSQVNHRWFHIAHYYAAIDRFSYASYAGLEADQILYGLRKGLTRDQIEGITDKWQLRGMARGGLSREQVNYPWFSQAHAYAAKAGIPYAKYQGLTEMQVKFIMRGLCRKQVEGLDIEPLNLVSRYQLPAAEIFRGCLSHADNLRAVRDFKVSQKVALAMGGYLKFDADCPIGDKKVLETIGSYL